MDEDTMDDGTMDDGTDIKRARWRCRRGMRELDQLMLRWVDQRWTQSSDRQRGVFLRLLDSEDDRLWKWCLGHEHPDDEALDTLVQDIRKLPAVD